MTKAVKDESQVEKGLATLLAGDFFGEGALLSGRGRSATVRATEDTVLLRLSHKKFVQLVGQDPEAAMGITLGIVKGLNARLYKTNERLMAIYNVVRLIPRFQGDVQKVVSVIFSELKRVLEHAESALFAMDGLARFKMEGMTEKTLSDLQMQIPNNAHQLNQADAPDYLSAERRVFFGIHDPNGVLVGILATVFHSDFQEEDLHLLGIIAEQLGIVFAKK